MCYEITYPLPNFNGWINHVRQWNSPRWYILFSRRWHLKSIPQSSCDCIPYTLPYISIRSDDDAVSKANAFQKPWPKIDIVITYTYAEVNYILSSLYMRT